MVDVAQLVEPWIVISSCRGFESRHSPQFRSIAQPGSAPGLGPGVVGSNLLFRPYLKAFKLLKYPKY